MTANTHHNAHSHPDFPPAREASRWKRKSRAIAKPDGPPGKPCLREWAGLLLVVAAVAAILPLPSLLSIPGVQPRLAWAQETAKQPAVAMAQAEVIIHGKVIRVDMADTPTLQSRGLGGRKRLGPLQGMLFVYGSKDKQTFWMRNMFIPIDIIWLDNGVVVHIAPRVQPPKPDTPDSNLAIYTPDKPANMVLELASGRARELGLKVGQKVDFRFDVQ